MSGPVFGAKMPMKILFVHQNFPGQFKHLVPALKARGDQLAVLCMNSFVPGPGHEDMPVLRAKLTRGNTPGIHPWLSDFESKVLRAEATYRQARALKAQGFEPDVIVAHHGWGESLFLRDVWPQARVGLYCEFFYALDGADSNFDAEFPPQAGEDDACRMRLKNANNWLHFSFAQAGLSPTQWQASTFPPPWRDRITVIHDGIDCKAVAPNAAAQLRFKDGTTLGKTDEVITFVNRNLEPYRGYHIFMRALPELLRRRPNAHVLIVGDKGVSYGAPPAKGSSWREIFWNEVKDSVDTKRVHFLGQLPYALYLALLQVSSVHVYLTYPFVLSWSLLEAMSIGCAIVASDTAPLREAIHHGETGRLVPFFDGARLVDEVCALLESPAEQARLGANARAFAQQHYDLRSKCLPQQLTWIDQLETLSL